MPLFNKKFESKPIPIRTGRCNIGCPPVPEDLDDFNNITLNLGNKEFKFMDGIWIHPTKKNDCDDFARINKKVKRLEEENNLHQMKVEILLDLLTEHVSELNAIKQERGEEE